MKSARNYLINIALLAVIFFLTYRLMFADTEFSEIMEIIRSASPGWVALGALSALLFVSCEGFAIQYMLHVMKLKISTPACLKYTFIGFFFSYITPSSTGGQPAQMYYMKKDGIKIGHSAVIMLLITISYKVSLLAMGALFLLFEQDVVQTYTSEIKGLLVLGFILSGGLIAGLILLLRKPVAVRDAGIKLVNRLSAKKLMRDQKAERYRGKLNRICDNYTAGAAYIKENPKSIFVLFCITTMERLLLMVITWTVYHSFGLSSAGFWEIITIQTLISVAVEMLPLPGAAGVTEWCFVLVFTEIFTQGLVKPALLITRGLSFYLVLIVGGLTTLVTHVMMLRRAGGIKAAKLAEQKEKEAEEQ
ncbi:MAG: flippase-like domain-containing protein [Oscillospiraceae bacterium]|nr:flippase-like domain-containing protein [Oscillospiraceae bacterium]